MGRERWNQLVLVGLGFIVGFQILAAMVNATGQWTTVNEVSAGGGGARLPLTELEYALRPISRPFRNPDRAVYSQHNQSFLDYYKAHPGRLDPTRRILYLTTVGELGPEDRQVFDASRAYLEAYFQVPVEIRGTIGLDAVPTTALSGVSKGRPDRLDRARFLKDVLEPGRPADALAYVAFAPLELWPSREPRESGHTGATTIVPIHRPDPSATGPVAKQVALKRTIAFACRELGRLLSIPECLAFECNQNPGETLADLDRAALHTCPVCTRKLCWTLRADPIRRLESLRGFYEAHGFGDEVTWTTLAIARLEALKKLSTSDN